MWEAILILLLIFTFTNGHSIVISPDTNTFVLRNLNGNFIDGNRSSIYVHNGCIYNTEQVLTTKVEELSYSLPLYPSIQNLHCAVALRVVQEQVTIEKPFVDIVVYRDHSWMSTFKQKLCVTTALKNSEGKMIKGSCVFNESDAFVNACLIRQEIPFSWFKVNGHARQWTSSVKISYSVGSQCLNPQRSLTNQKINLINGFDKMQITSLSSQEFGQLSLMTRSNLTFVTGVPEPLFLHFRNDGSTNLNMTNSLKKIEVKLWIDSRLEISSATVLEPEFWSLKIASMTPPTFHTSFTLLNLSPKSRPQIDDYLFALVLKLKSIHEGSFSSEFEFSKIVSLHWALKFYFNEDEEVPETRVATKFMIGPDKFYAIAPVSRGSELINTAVISGVQAAIPMRVFSITTSGQVKDVTDDTHCISSEPKLLKTSPTCTSVFVDGSEMRGNSAIDVHVQFRTLTSTVIFSVWYPKLPITVWVADPILNAINEWRVGTLKDLSSKRRIRDARQFACKNRYQQTEIKVLAAFQVVDEATGERTYLTKDKDLMFDVTQLAMNRIQSADPSILAIKKKNGRLLGVPKRSGITRLLIKALAPAIDYGSALVTITEDRVSPTQLIVKPITNMELQLLPEVNNPLQYELVTRVQSTFTHQYQHGVAEVYIFYSDGQRELLSDVETKEFSLGVYSSDDNLLRINQQKGHPSVELVALGDGSEVTITVEVHCPTYCEDAEAPPIVYGQTNIKLFLENSNPKEIGSRTTRMDQLTMSNSTMFQSDLQQNFNLQPILVVLLTLVFIIGLFHLVTGRRSLHNGYEKLVVPLLAKLSSSNSINEGKNEGDDVKEWVWFPKEQIDDRSIGSRYSQRSTLEMYDKNTSRGSSSPEEGNHKSVSVSYRGSEISVFISPQPSVAVNEDPRMSNSLHLHDRYRDREIQNYASTSMLRNARPERRISDHSPYYRSQNQYFVEPYYQSVGNLKRTRFDGTQRQFTISGEAQRPRITYPVDYNGAGFRESIA